MAKNTGRDSRHGEVTARSQFKTPQGNWAKRNTDTGRIMDQKEGGKPFKGIRREK